MQAKHHYELTAQGSIVQKELLVKLALNKNSEQLEANPYTLASKKSFRIKIGRSPSLQAEEERGDFEEFVRECLASKRRLERKDRLRLVRGFQTLQARDSILNSFTLLFSEAYLAQLAHPNDYELLLASVGLYPDSFFFVISKDIPRTFSTQADPALQSKLRNVLYAYAIRNPHMLYCQGLNYVAGCFLTSGYCEEETFWLLVRLIEEILPSHYYVDMGPVISLSNVLKDIVAEVLPELLAILERAGLELSMIVVPWLVCLFTKGFSKELTDYILGLIIIEGKAALLKASIAVLKLAGPKLDDSPDMTVLFKQFESEVKGIILKDFKLVYDSVYLSHYFSSVLFESYLKEYWQITDAQNREDALKGHNLLPECDPKCPICLHIVEINRRFRNQEFEVETLRLGKDLQPEEEYFNQVRIHSPGNGKFKVSVLNDVLVGRHKHICQQGLPARKLTQGDLQKIVKENLDIEAQDQRSTAQSPSKQQPIEPPPTIKQKVLRKGTIKKIQDLSEIFEVIKDYTTKEIDVIDEALNEQKHSKLSKRASLVKVAGETTSLLGFIKKLF